MQLWGGSREQSFVLFVSAQTGQVSWRQLIILFKLPTPINGYWVFGVCLLPIHHASAIYSKSLTYFLIHSILGKTEWRFLELSDCINIYFPNWLQTQTGQQSKAGSEKLNDYFCDITGWNWTISIESTFNPFESYQSRQIVFHSLYKRQRI